MLTLLAFHLISQFSVQTIGSMGLPGQERNLMISLAIWIQYTNATDGRVDRHRPTASTMLMHSVAQ